MNFDDLKDKISEALSQAWDQIQENPAFNSANEQFQTLPSTTQKVISLTAFAAVVLCFLMVPWSYLSSSSTQTEEFEENRELIRKILKAKTERDGLIFPKTVTSGSLKSKVQRVVDKARLIPSQITSVRSRPANSGESKLIPAPFKKVVVEASLKDLNIKQISDVGFNLQGLGNNIKLAGLEMIQSSKNEGYFDVKYSVLGFFMEIEKEDSGKKRPKKSRRSRSKRRNK